jgi:class 3 adenylate cyclase
MRLNKKLEKEARQVYNLFWDSYLIGDEPAFASALDDDFKLIGTAESEIAGNKTEALRWFRNSAREIAGKAELRNRKISASQVHELILVSEMADIYLLIDAEWRYYSKIRLSTILANTPAGWKLVHQHASIPDSKAQEGETVSFEKISEENQELREAVKRRTVELENKNRVLEIESSLERVRTVAMGMNQPADMLEICRTIAQQLQLLNVKDIRNIQTAIFHPTIDSYANYEYFMHADKTIITEVQYNSHPIVAAFASQMKKAPDSFFAKSFTGSELPGWIEYQQQSGQFIDPRQYEATSVNYYFYSIGYGALGISTYTPLSEEEITLYKRFRNVFELAYRRYVDIEKAEAHALQAQVEEQKLRDEKNRSDSLLLNILPEEIASELKAFGKSYPRKHEQVTILFADIKGFSGIAETLSADELVTQLDECFRAFDNIVEKHGLEKIKTVGDAYLCACGLPKPVDDHAAKTVAAALDMISFIRGFGMTKRIQNLPVFEFRIGIHSGPVVTGVVGMKKFTYDVWGDAVNLAARMEQHGEPGKINLSGTTYELVKDKFRCQHRGKIKAKNKGEIDMYFVLSDALVG